MRMKSTGVVRVFIWRRGRKGSLWQVKWRNIPYSRLAHLFYYMFTPKEAVQYQSLAILGYLRMSSLFWIIFLFQNRKEKGVSFINGIDCVWCGSCREIQLCDPVVFKLVLLEESWNFRVMYIRVRWLLCEWSQFYFSGTDQFRWRGISIW